MAYNEEKNQSKLTQKGHMIELVDKDIWTVIITVFPMFKELKEGLKLNVDMICWLNLIHNEWEKFTLDILILHDVKYN